MQYEGSNLELEGVLEVVNMEWFGEEFRLKKSGEAAPRYHDDCPVGWRTTRIDDLARFLPELGGSELCEAWRKFQRDDIQMIDWMPTEYVNPENDEYMSFFPMFNFQQPGCYSCLAYLGEFPPEPSLEPINVMDSIMDMEEQNEDGACNRKTERSAIVPPNLRDPCGGVPRPPWLPRLKAPYGHCCRMFDLKPPPLPVVVPTPSRLHERSKPPIDPSQDPYKEYENLPDVSDMTEVDWEDCGLMGDFGYKGRPWVRLPPLNFLPTDVDHIIAGEKGFLVVDGGWQPRDRIEGEYDLPMQDKWDLGMYPAQTITIVCNPLLKRYDYVSPFPNRHLNHKMARMEVKPDPLLEGAANMYNIYFVGYNFIPNTTKHGDEILSNPKDIHVQEEVIVAVYNSNVKNWIATFSRPYVRFLQTNQTNNLALINNRLYWISEWADHGRQIKVQNNAIKAPELKWFPVVSCFDFNSQKFTGFALCQDLYHKKVENCLLMECNGNLYIVSRASASNTKVPKGRFEVWVAAYKEGSIKLEYKKVGRMPLVQYEYLFNNCYICFGYGSEPTYECRAGLSMICFYVPQCGTGVLFDVNKCTWINMERHPGWDLDKKAKFCPPDYSKNALASCIWEPNFKAMWTKQYMGPKWDPLCDDPTGPVK